VLLDQTGAQSVSLLVLQSTSFCNIDCKYCYLPDRSKKTSMSEKVISATCDRLVEANLVGPEINICWHAGEPLTLPISYYARAIEIIREHLPRECAIQFKFQTNGILISHDWCEFFRKYEVQVGVSIDGPPELNDLMRRSRSGKATSEQTRRGIRLLREARVSFNIICVLTNDSMNKAKELFEFFCNEHIEHVCFNIEETEGVHRSQLISAGSSEAKFRSFYREYALLTSTSKKLHWVREIDAPFRVMFAAERDRALNQQVTPFAIVTIDWQGSLSTFSPELIGMTAPRFGDFKFGNVLHHSIAVMREAPTFLGALNEIENGVELCRSNCEYFAICGGGAPSNKFFENGSLASSETAYCRSIIKTTADVLLDLVLEETEAKRGCALSKQ
jgi:uncharacterized protein